MCRLLFPLTLTLIVLFAVPMAAIAQDRGGGGDCRQEGPLPGRIRCFLDAAMAAGDAGLCDSAADSTVRFHCISRFAENSGDAAPCERIRERDNPAPALRDSCISGVAAATRMPELCEQVRHDAVRDACFLILVVERNAAPGYCERITRPVLRESCLTPPSRRP